MIIQGLQGGLQNAVLRKQLLCPLTDKEKEHAIFKPGTLRHICRDLQLSSCSLSLSCSTSLFPSFEVLQASRNQARIFQTKQILINANRGIPESLPGYVQGYKDAPYIGT